MDNFIGVERIQLYQRIKILGEPKLIHTGSAIIPVGYNVWSPDKVIVYKRVIRPAVDGMDGKQDDMFVADCIVSVPSTIV
jgi:hypothetical protein